MILHRRAPAIWVFGVDVDAVQICWRSLRPGALTFTCEGRTHAAVSDGGPGATTFRGLPTGQLLAIEVTGRALVDPVELAARTLAPLPGEELVRFATLSDLHLGTEVFGHRGTIAEPDRHRHEHAHPRRCTEAAIDEAAAWGATRLIVKGDITNYGTPDQWRTYAELVAGAPMPVDAIPGNHDHGRPGAHGPLLPSEAARAFGLSIARPVLVRDLPGLRVVLVDTTRAGRHGGTVAPVADDVLDATAEADRAGGVLVVLHHQLQPRPLADGWPPGIAADESRALLDRLGAAHPHVLVTSGHTHRSRRWGRAGVVVTQVGSTKDYPGVWAGYRVHEGGIAQTVHRVERADCIGWTDHSRVAAFGAWEHASPGRLDSRCFTMPWSRTVA